MKKILFILIILLLAISMVITGSSKGEVVLKSREAVTLDPQYTDVVGGLRIICNINESLVKEDEDAKKFIPWIAEKWEISDDGMECTFYLSKGNKFHNGIELTADDVKFTFDRAMNSPYTLNFVTCIKDVKVVDNYTVKIEMKYSYSPFLSFVSSPYLAIVNREAVESGGDEYGRNPIGTGPYKFVEWKSGNYIKLEAYEDYHLGSPAIKNIKVRFIEDQTTAVIALEKGELDVFYETPPAEKQSIIDNPKLGYSEMNACFIDYLVVNNEVPTLSDPKVRQAIARILNYEDILEVYAGGNGIIPNNDIPPGIFGYDESVKGYSYDKEKAKELLDEAGYPNGFTTKIMVNNEDANLCAQVIQANLSEINIDAEIELFEQGAFYECQTSGNYEMLINGYEFNGGDADTGLYPNYHSSMIDSRNPSRYNNPEVDKLLDKARVSSDKAERGKLYSEISSILHEDIPMIPLDLMNIGTAYNNDLQGVKATQFGYFYFDDWSWK